MMSQLHALHQAANVRKSIDWLLSNLIGYVVCGQLFAVVAAAQTFTDCSLQACIAFQVTIRHLDTALPYSTSLEEP